jgi:hypothetical protein
MVGFCPDPMMSPPIITLLPIPTKPRVLTFCKAEVSSDVIEGAQERLALYQQHRPFRLKRSG